MVETYSFHITYPTATQIQLTSKIQANGKQKGVEEIDVTSEKIVKSTVQLMRTVLVLTQTLAVHPTQYRNILIFT